MDPLDGWVAITRRGDLFIGWSSADGQAWIRVGEQLIADLPDTLLAGFAAVGGDTSSELRTFEALQVTFDWSVGPVLSVFRRGDCNDDGKLDISDPLANLSFQFVGTFDPLCLDALDFDDSGELDVTDPIANLTHQFLGGPPPAPPGKEVCGVDSTDDELSCDSFAACP